MTPLNNKQKLEPLNKMSIMTTRSKNTSSLTGEKESATTPQRLNYSHLMYKPGGGINNRIKEILNKPQ